MSKKFAAQYQELKTEFGLAPPLFYRLENGMITVCVLYNGELVQARGMTILSYTEPGKKISRRNGNMRALGRAVKALRNNDSGDRIQLHLFSRFSRRQYNLMIRAADISIYKSLRCPYSCLNRFELSLLDKRRAKNEQKGGESGDKS